MFNSEVVDKQCWILLTVIIVTQPLRYGASRAEKSLALFEFSVLSIWSDFCYTKKWWNFVLNSLIVSAK